MTVQLRALHQSHRIHHVLRHDFTVDSRGPKRRGESRRWNQYGHHGFIDRVGEVSAPGRRWWCRHVAIPSCRPPSRPTPVQSSRLNGMPRSTGGIEVGISSTTGTVWNPFGGASAMTATRGRRRRDARRRGGRIEHRRVPKCSGHARRSTRGRIDRRGDHGGVKHAGRNGLHRGPTADLSRFEQPHTPSMEAVDASEHHSMVSGPDMIGGVTTRVTASADARIASADSTDMTDCTAARPSDAFPTLVYSIMPRPLLLALPLLAAALPLAAQSIRVRTVEAETGRPIAGAIVVLLDSAGRRVVQGLTDDLGRISFPAAPRHLSPEGRSDRTSRRPRRLLQRSSRRTRSRWRCRPSDSTCPRSRSPATSVCGRSENDETARLWEEIRKALSASQITSSSESVELSVRRFIRYRSLSGSLRSDSTTRTLHHAGHVRS